MAVNLATKYEKQFAAAFKPTSIFEGKVNSQYNWEGAKEIAVYSPVTVELNDYKRSGNERFGKIEEMSTSLQKMALRKDKSFIQALDRGNYTDQQMAISAGAWLQEEIKSVATPHTEKCAMAEYINNAGGVNTISAAPTKSTITEALAGLVVGATNAYAPEDGRYLYVKASSHGLLRLSPEFVGNDKLGEKALAKGQIGTFMGAKVIATPDSYFPANSYALLARKDSILLPRKIAMFTVKSDPDNIDGWLMRGRLYFDAFVLGAKCGGVQSLVLASAKQATPTITYASSAISIASNGASEIYYTVDGTDPRYSSSAEKYASAVSTAGFEDGDYTVKAVAYKSGGFASDVAESTITVS